MAPVKRAAERRKYARFKSYDLLELLDPTTGAPFHKNTTLVNISEGGLQFYSGDVMRSKERVRLKIEIGEFNSTVTCYGRVVWCQKSTEHPGAFFTGVEFVGLGENDRDILRRLEKTGRERA